VIVVGSRRARGVVRLTQHCLDKLLSKAGASAENLSREWDV
jgi:hypothetical protein